MKRVCILPDRTRQMADELSVQTWMEFERQATRLRATEMDRQIDGHIKP